MHMELLEKCIEVMRDNVESDCEDGGARYSLMWVGTEPSVVCFRRTTYYDTGERYEDGSLDIQSYTRDVFEMGCSLESYCNLAIALLNHMDEYKDEYGNEIGKIKLMPVWNGREEFYD